jgi:hypothetical protein
VSEEICKESVAIYMIYAINESDSLNLLFMTVRRRKTGREENGLFKENAIKIQA